jgi:hypothetical protein
VRTLIVASSLMITSAAAWADSSPLLGKPLPELRLSQPIQGEAWSSASIRGRVAVLEVFQWRCPGCMTNSLPHAQRLVDRYRGDARVVVVGIATAFEKEDYPFMADVGGIATGLREQGWQFPVMRDAEDERVVLALRPGERTGTPMTLVVDADGLVRWHGFNGNTETAREIDQAVEAQLEQFYVAPPAPSVTVELVPAAAEFARKNYGQARDLAQAVFSQSSASSETRDCAATIIAAIDAGPERLAKRAEVLLSPGYPTRALAALEEGLGIFRGVPAASAITNRIKAWKASANVRRSLAAEREMVRICSSLAQAREKDRAGLLKRLQTLAKNYEDTAVAARIRREMPQ